MPEFFTAASLSSLLQAAFFTPAIHQEWRHTWVRFWKVNADCCKNMYIIAANVECWHVIPDLRGQQSGTGVIPSGAMSV